jgi:ATP-dependent Clp protease ATP-binding subunit ClpC
MAFEYPDPHRSTERAREVLQFARTEAEALQHGVVRLEHLLLGLLDVQDGIAAQVLHDLGVTLPAARMAVAVHLSAVPHSASVFALDVAAQQAVADAVDEANGLRHHYWGTEHLLLGLMRTQDAQATTFFTGIGVIPDKVRGGVLNMMRTGQTGLA